MTVRELKELLSNAPEEVLDQCIGYHFPDMGCSGYIEEFIFAKEDMYYDGEDDPSELKTKDELLKLGYDENEIASNFMIEIHKGDPIIIL